MSRPESISTEGFSWVKTGFFEFLSLGRFVFGGGLEASGALRLQMYRKVNIAPYFPIENPLLAVGKDKWVELQGALVLLGSLSLPYGFHRLTVVAYHTALELDARWHVSRFCSTVLSDLRTGPVGCLPLEAHLLLDGADLGTSLTCHDRAANSGITLHSHRWGVGFRIQTLRASSPKSTQARIFQGGGKGP